MTPVLLPEQWRWTSPFLHTTTDFGDPLDTSYPQSSSLLAEELCSDSSPEIHSTPLVPHFTLLCVFSSPTLLLTPHTLYALVFGRQRRAPRMAEERSAEAGGDLTSPLAASRLSGSRIVQLRDVVWAPHGSILARVFWFPLHGEKHVRFGGGKSGRLVCSWALPGHRFATRLGCTSGVGSSLTLSSPLIYT